MLACKHNANKGHNATKGYVEVDPSAKCTADGMCGV